VVNNFLHHQGKKSPPLQKEVGYIKNLFPSTPTERNNDKLRSFLFMGKE